MLGRMEMMIAVDVVAPGAAPAVAGEQHLIGFGGDLPRPLAGRDEDGVIDDERQAGRFGKAVQLALHLVGIDGGGHVVPPRSFGLGPAGLLTPVTK